MLIYLDFDGVLHPDEVYVVKGKIVLKSEGALFLFFYRLVEAIDDRLDVKIVLSTSWVREVGFRMAKSVLPESLQDRVIGGTYHTKIRTGWDTDSGDSWVGQSRYQQIAADRARRPEHQKWIAIDDDVAGWAESARGNLVQTDPALGLGDDKAFARLVSLLS